MAALHRAVALAERQHGPVGVGEELDLDVARPLDVALAEDRPVAEGRLRLARSGLERLLELVRLAHDPHPAAAASGRRLDEEREADLRRLARWARRARLPRAAIRFAASLSPPWRSASAGGPTQVRPAASTASAKSAFSARKP